MMMKFNETKEAFEHRYRKSNPKVIFGITHIAMPCDCEDGRGDPGEHHWAAIRNDPQSIQGHADQRKAIKELKSDDS